MCLSCFSIKAGPILFDSISRYRWLVHECDANPPGFGLRIRILLTACVGAGADIPLVPAFLAATRSLWMTTAAYGCHGLRTEVGTLSTLINTLWYAYHGEDQANFYLVRAWGKWSSFSTLWSIIPLRQPNCWKQDPSTCYSPFCSFSPVEVPHSDGSRTNFWLRRDWKPPSTIHKQEFRRGHKYTQVLSLKRVSMLTERNPMHEFE